MGLKIYPGEIQSFASEIGANVESLAGQLEDSLARIEDFEEEKDLDGVSWKGTKEQLASHKYVIQGIIAASDMMREDAYKLSSAAGNENLDEDQLLDELGSLQYMSRNLQQNLSIFRSNHGRILPDGSMMNCSYSIAIYSNLLDTCSWQIGVCQDKLERLRAIESSTNSLFQGAKDLFNAVESISASVAGSWNGSSFTGAPSAEAIDLIMGGWENTKTTRKLRQAGITMEQIQNMHELGYTAEEVLDIWDHCESKVDKDFFKNLMTGTKESYEKAFSLNPLEVSDYMMQIAADYSIKIFQIDEEGNLTAIGKRMFENFNNAILSVNIPCQHDTENGVSLSGPLLHSDVYLNKIYAYVSELTMSQAITMAAMDPGSDTYKQLDKELTKMIGLTNFWSSEIIFKETVQSLQGETGTLKMSLLNYNDGDIDYNLGHYSLLDDCYKEQSVNTQILWHPNDLDNQWTWDRLKELRKQRDEILKNTIISAGQSASLAALGILSPYASVAAGLLYMGIDGTSQPLSGLPDNVFGTSGQVGINIANDTVPDLINGVKEWLDTNSTLSQEQLKAKMEWFGIGGKCDISYSNEMLKPLGEINVLQYDIYDPDVIRGINVWEKEGIAGWMGWDENPDLITAMELEIGRIEELSISEKEECKKILGGGYDIYGVTDIDEFGRKIGKIQEAYKQAYNSVHKEDSTGKDSSVNIQDKWREYIS